MQADLAGDPSWLSADKLAEVLGIPAAQFSDLARHSIAALAHELTSLGWPDDEIPGFRGPDAWYAFRPPSP